MARFTLIVLSIVLGALIAVAFIIKGLIMMKHEKLREMERVQKAADSVPVKKAPAKKAVKKAPAKRKK